MPRFQVGDRVRVIENVERTPIGMGGQTGIVAEVFDEDTPAGKELLYGVKFDGVDPHWPIYESALEAAAPEA